MTPTKSLRQQHAAQESQQVKLRFPFKASCVGQVTPFPFGEPKAPWKAVHRSTACTRGLSFVFSGCLRSGAVRAQSTGLGPL